MNLTNDEDHTNYAQDTLVRVLVPGVVLLGAPGVAAAGLRLRGFV